MNPTFSAVLLNPTAKAAELKISFKASGLQPGTPLDLSVQPEGDYDNIAFENSAVNADSSGKIDLTLEKTVLSFINPGTLVFRALNHNIGIDWTQELQWSGPYKPFKISISPKRVSKDALKSTVFRIDFPNELVAMDAYEWAVYKTDEDENSRNYIWIYNMDRSNLTPYSNFEYSGYIQFPWSKGALAPGEYTLETFGNPSFGKASTTFTVTEEEEPQPQTPTVSVSKIADISPAGEWIEVKGTGFVRTSETIANRSPFKDKWIGIQIAVNTLGEIWKPSEGAGSLKQPEGNDNFRWFIDDESLIGQPGLDLVELIEADGSFTTQLWVEKITNPEGYNFGIYVASGPTRPYAPYEFYIPLSFAAPVDPPDPEEDVDRPIDAYATTGDVYRRLNYNYSYSIGDPLIGEERGLYEFLVEFSELLDLHLDNTGNDPEKVSKKLKRALVISRGSKWLQLYDVDPSLVSYTNMVGDVSKTESRRSVSLDALYDINPVDLKRLGLKTFKIASIGYDFKWGY